MGGCVEDRGNMDDMSRPTGMVNNGHLGSIREEVNYPVYRRWDVGCGLAQVNSVNGEVKSVIVLPHDSDSVAPLQEST